MNESIPADIPTVTVRPSSETPALTPLQMYREDNPQYGKINDLVLTRGLYEQGGFAREGETFEDFATRAGVKVAPAAALANRTATTLAFGADKPIQAGLSGLISMIQGDGFDKGYMTKRQQIDDGLAVGRAQNPVSDIAGNVAGYANLYRAIPQLALSGSAAAIPLAAKAMPYVNSVVKALGLGGAQEIPAALEREVQAPDGPSLSRGAEDVGKSAYQNGLASLAGAGGAKLLASGAGLASQALGGAASHILGGAAGKLISLPVGGLAAVIRGVAEPSRMLPKIGQDAAKGIPGLWEQTGRIFQDDARHPPGAPANFPELYDPPAQPEKRSELDTKRLAEADPQDVVRHVAERISPEVAQQIADAGESGYGAAMFSLMSQPQYRQALSANPEGQSNA